MKPTPEAIKALLEYHQGRANAYKMSADAAMRQWRAQDHTVYTKRGEIHLAHIETIKELAGIHIVTVVRCLGCGCDVENRICGCPAGTYQVDETQHAIKELAK